MSRAIAGTVLVAWLCSLLHAQSTANAKHGEPKLEFEVASVKPSALPAGNGVIRLGPQGGPGAGDPGRLTYSFSTIRDLTEGAYSVTSPCTAKPKSCRSTRWWWAPKVPSSKTPPPPVRRPRPMRRLARQVSAQ